MGQRAKTDFCSLFFVVFFFVFDFGLGVFLLDVWDVVFVDVLGGYSVCIGCDRCVVGGALFWPLLSLHHALIAC